MTIEILWPERLSPRVVTMQLIGQSRSLSTSISGVRQVASAVAQRWRLTLDFNTLKREEVLAFRSLIAQFEGRLNYCRVPVWDKRLESPTILGSLSNGVPYEGSPHSDNTEFSDGSIYVSSSVALDSVSAQSGSRQFDADLSDIGDVLVSGHYVGIGDHVYMVTSVDYNGEESTLSVMPSLRQTYTDADLTMRPTLICRLTDDSIGDLPLDMGLRGSPSLDLEEIVL